MMSLASVNKQIVVKKNTILADNNYIVKTGKGFRLYTNKDVQNAAKIFDLKLKEFELKAEHVSDNEFKLNLKDLVKDWRGDDESEEGSFNFDPGYYRELKNITWANNEEMKQINYFEEKLSNLQQNKVLVKSGLSVEDLSNLASSKLISPEQLDENVNTLWSDIKKDACSESYGPECEGSDLDVDTVSKCILEIEKKGGVVDAKSILECAGIEATQENIDKFKSCVQARKDAFGSLPRGSLAYCAVAVKKQLSLGKTHTNQAWRDKYETWMRAYLASDKSNLETYVNQYNSFRKDFISKGGETSSIEVSQPKLIPTWVYYVIGGVVALIVIGQVSTIAQSISALRK